MNGNEWSRIRVGPAPFYYWRKFSSIAKVRMRT